MNTSIIVVFMIVVFAIYLFNKYGNVKKTDLDVDLVSHLPNIPDKNCDIFRAIKPCTSNSNCTACKCSDDSALSGCMTCQVIDNSSKDFFKNFYVNLTEDQCKPPSDPNFTGFFPYEWVESEQSCRLKNGSYCLPTVMQDIYCNPFTSRKVLFNLGEQGYQWKCICKDPTRFNQGVNSYADCNHINLCGMQGSAINPDPITQRGLYHIDADGSAFTCNIDDDCEPGDKCVGGTPGSAMKTGKCYWQSGPNGSVWDPTKPYGNGKPTYACQCGPEEVPDAKGNCVPQKCPGGRQKCIDGAGQAIQTCTSGQTCVYGGTTCSDSNPTCTSLNTRDSEGNCPSGTTLSDTECECGKGFIDCRTIAYTQNQLTGSPYYNGACTVPSCIPDPCSPNGKFDPITKNCVCNTGYDIMLTPYSVVGQKCVNLCSDDYNPCGNSTFTDGTYRGDCYVDKSLSQLFNIIGINNADSSPSEYFFVRYMSNPSNNLYRYVVVDNSDNLVLSDEKPSTYSPQNGLFKIKPYCDPTTQPVNSTCPLIVGSLTLNDSYFFMYKDTTNNNNRYVDWVGKKVLAASASIDTNVLMGDPSLYPSSNWPTLIKLVNLDPKTIAQTDATALFRNSRNMNCYFFDPKNSAYIDINRDTNQLREKIIYTTPRCGRSWDDGINTTNPLTCKDGYYIGGKNRDMCVNPNYCRGFHIQDSTKMCNGTPSCGSDYRSRYAECENKGGSNNCGIDYYPVCSLNLSPPAHCECICKDIVNADSSKYKYNDGNINSTSVYKKYRSALEGARENIQWCPSYNPSNNDNSYINIF